jgi:hypothetical protein
MDLTDLVRLSKDLRIDLERIMLDQASGDGPLLINPIDIITNVKDHLRNATRIVLQSPDVSKNIKTMHLVEMCFDMMACACAKVRITIDDVPVSNISLTDTAANLDATMARAAKRKFSMVQVAIDAIVDGADITSDAMSVYTTLTVANPYAVTLYAELAQKAMDACPGQCDRIINLVEFVKDAMLFDKQDQVLGTKVTYENNPRLNTFGLSPIHESQSFHDALELALNPSQQRQHQTTPKYDNRSRDKYDNRSRDKSNNRSQDNRSRDKSNNRSQDNRSRDKSNNRSQDNRSQDNRSQDNRSQDNRSRDKSNNRSQDKYDNRSRDKYDNRSQDNKHRTASRDKSNNRSRSRSRSRSRRRGGGGASISNAADMARKHAICIVVLNNVIRNPIEFQLWQLTEWERAKNLIQEPTTGVNAKLINRFKTTTSYTKLKGVKKQAWDFSTKHYGDLGSDRFVILEHLGADRYRCLGIHEDDRNYTGGGRAVRAIPREKLNQFINYVENKGVMYTDTRLSAYHTLQQRKIIQTMFLPVKFDPSSIKEASRTEDTSLLKYSITNKLVSACMKLAQQKKIKDMVGISTIIHDESLAALFAEETVKQFNTYTSEAKHQSTWEKAEIMQTLLHSMQLVNRDFVRNMHDMMVEANITVSVLDKKSTLEAMFRDVIGRTIDKLISNKANIYQTLSYKNSLLKLSVV